MMNHKKRTVYLVVQHLCPGGIEVLAIKMIEKLSALYDVQIIALEGSKAEAIQKWPILENHEDHITCLDKKAGLSPLALLKLLYLFIRHRPIAVHTHHIGPLLYGGLAARLIGVQSLIHTEHDGWHLQENGKLQTKIIKHLKPKMIAVANHVGECVARHCNTDKPHTIYNGIDKSYYNEGNKAPARTQLALPNDRRIIGCAGRIEEVKGQRYLIEALQYLPKDINVAIAGDGSLKNEIETYAKELNLQSRTHFLGRLDEMKCFYHALDVFCLPSLNEGFPLSPLEAQSCGIPAVLSDVGGCGEALCPDTGLLAEAGNAENLSQKLLSALNAKRAVSPRNFILKHFDLAEMAGHYATLYQGDHAQKTIKFSKINQLKTPTLCEER